MEHSAHDFICPNCRATNPLRGAVCATCKDFGHIDADLASAPGRSGMVGRIIDRRFVILRALGAGGFGEVFLALEIGQGQRQVALKLPQRSDNPRAVLLPLQREIMAVSGLRNPHTVTLLTTGSDDDLGRPYIAFEYVEGHTLDADTRPWTWPRIAHVLNQILLSLTEAHGRGIVHRDLKPQNIMLTTLNEDPDYVKVVDFGIARVQTRLTQSANFTGTPLYASPEQIRADDHIDGRADLYSLAAITWELVTGAPPFDGESTVQVIYKHLQDPLPAFTPRSGVEPPPGLGPLLIACLSKDPDARPADARTLRTKLKALAPGSAALHTPTVSTPPPRVMRVTAPEPAIAPRPPEPEPTPEPDPQPESDPTPGPTPEPAPTPKATAPKPTPPAPTSPRKRPIGLIVAALVVLGLVGGGVIGTVVYLRGRDAKPPAKTASNTTTKKTSKKTTPKKKKKPKKKASKKPKTSKKAAKPPAPKPASPAATFCGERDQSACLERMSDLYRRKKYQDAVLLAYAAPAPLGMVRFSMAHAAELETSWGTRERFKCPADKDAPCVLWDFWHADHGGPLEEAALERLKARCAKDDADACLRLGLVLEDRLDQPQKALEAYDKAARGGNTDAIVPYASLALTLSPGAKDPAELVLTTCDEGHLYACWFAGDILYSQNQHKEATTRYTRACEGGIAEACNALGVIAHNADPKEGWRKANPRYAESCDRGYIIACHNQGLVEDNALDNWDKALDLYHRACDLGWGAACHAIVVSHNARRKPLPAAEARALLKVGCEEHHAPSCEALKAP